MGNEPRDHLSVLEHEAGRFLNGGIARRCGSQLCWLARWVTAEWFIYLRSASALLFFSSLFWEGSPLPSALMFTNILFYIFLFFNCTICLVVRMRPAWEDLMLCYAFSFPVESRWYAFLFWQGPGMIDLWQLKSSISPCLNRARRLVLTTTFSAFSIC